MDQSKLARRIRAFRKLKNITQRELANRLTISLASLGEIERGHREVDEKLIREIADVIGVSVEELEDV